MASSITTWQRLEPLPRSDDLRPGLRAEIADPLWLLARQRQFGELRGDDAGSPVNARYEATAARISRLHRGVPGTDAATTSVDHDDRALPLEVAVTRELVRPTPQGGGLAVEAGLHFLRLLRVHGAQAYLAAYVTHYAVRAEDLPGDDPATVRLRRRAVNRVPHGLRLYDDLRLARGTAAQLTALPADPVIPSADAANVLAAANAYLQRWDAQLSEPAAGTPSAWDPHRMEHVFAVQADLPSGAVVLLANEYHGGRLDWYDFTADTGPDLGRPADARPGVYTVRTTLPAPVWYGGKPASRFWEIEDGTVRFGALATGRTDLARLLLAEFALSYGDDWFVVPIDLPVGSLCAVDSVQVTDTFGVVTSIPRSADASWHAFELTAPGAPDWVRSLFFLAPTLAEIASSDPVEDVLVARDELANIVWGIERRYQGAAGTSVDRYAAYQVARAAQQHVQTDFGDAQLIYRLASDVPDYWFPFVPVRPADAPPDSGVIELERRPLVRVLADGSTSAPAPLGRLLTAADPLRVAEQEVPRSGVELTRTYQLARWADGHYLLWSGPGRRTGRGESSSGQRFDTVLPALRS